MMNKTLKKLLILLMFIVACFIIYMAITFTFATHFTNFLLIIVGLFIILQSLGWIDNINNYNQSNKHNIDNNINPENNEINNNHDNNSQDNNEEQIQI